MKLAAIRADMEQSIAYGLPPGEQSAKLILVLVEIAEAAQALLGDLSDAERAIAGWKFTGGMGANIATEDKGRFPSFASRSHREKAEAALAELGRL